MCPITVSDCNVWEAKQKQTKYRQNTCKQTRNSQNLDDLGTDKQVLSRQKKVTSLKIRIEAVGIVLCKTVLQKLTQKKNLEMLFGK